LTTPEYIGAPVAPQLIITFVTTAKIVTVPANDFVVSGSSGQFIVTISTIDLVMTFVTVDSVVAVFAIQFVVTFMTKDIVISFLAPNFVGTAKGNNVVSKLSSVDVVIVICSTCLILGLVHIVIIKWVKDLGSVLFGVISVVDSVVLKGNFFEVGRTWNLLSDKYFTIDLDVKDLSSTNMASISTSQSFLQLLLCLSFICPLCIVCSIGVLIKDDNSHDDRAFIDGRNIDTIWRNSKD